MDQNRFLTKSRTTNSLFRQN